MSGVNMNGIGSIANLQASGNIDVEMFMMQISAQRASNLESQMKDQVNEVKARQEVIGGLTKLVNALSSLIKAKQQGEEVTLPEQTMRPDLDKHDWKTVLEEAGLVVQSDDENASNYLKRNYVYTGGGCMPGAYTLAPGDAFDATMEGPSSAARSIVGPTQTLVGVTAKKEIIEGWIDGLKGNIDGLNSQGQLDMIRLQSIMNKRNESFEQMTNMMQKFNKARESIVRNI